MFLLTDALKWAGIICCATPSSISPSALLRSNLTPLAGGRARASMLIDVVGATHFLSQSAEIFDRLALATAERPENGSSLTHSQNRRGYDDSESPSWFG